MGKLHYFHMALNKNSHCKFADWANINVCQDLSVIDSKHVIISKPLRYFFFFSFAVTVLSDTTNALEEKQHRNVEGLND